MGPFSSPILRQMNKKWVNHGDQEMWQIYHSPEMTRIAIGGGLLIQTVIISPLNGPTPFASEDQFRGSTSELLSLLWESSIVFGRRPVKERLSSLDKRKEAEKTL